MGSPRAYHDPATAATKTEQRNERIDALIRQADEWSGKLPPVPI